MTCHARGLGFESRHSRHLKSCRFLDSNSKILNLTYEEVIARKL